MTIAGFAEGLNPLKNLGWSASAGGVPCSTASLGASVLVGVLAALASTAVFSGDCAPGAAAK